MSDSTAASPPSAAIIELLSPDGYYTYLGIEKDTPEDSIISNIDEEQVKKNYRRLSLKHHPDRPSGDAETFRVLNRAQKVLLNPKLRQQYDWIGLDLDDDEDDDNDNENEGNDGNETNSNDNTPTTHEEQDEQQQQQQESTGGNPSSVISQLASMTLSVIFQCIMRTIMMGLVACLLVRYRLFLFPSLAFVLFVSYRIHTVNQANAISSTPQTLAPLMIGVGLLLMYRGRVYLEERWTTTFWTGESLVMTMFLYNSLTETPKTPALTAGLAIFSFCLTLWLRGNAWTYATLVGLECVVAAMAACAFPIMEMLLEQLMAEKLRRVGEKVRAQAQRTRAFYDKR